MGIGGAEDEVDKTLLHLKPGPLLPRLLGRYLLKREEPERDLFKRGNIGKAYQNSEFPANGHDRFERGFH